MNIKKKLILLSSCLMLTGFALVRNVTKEDVQEVRAEEETPVYTLNCDAYTNNSNYKTEYTINDGNISWHTYGVNMQNNPWKFGGKSGDNNNLKTLTSQTVLSHNICKIAITFGDETNEITVNGITLSVSTDPNFEKDLKSYDISYTVNSTTIIESDSDSWKNCYYKFAFNLTSSNSSKNKSISVSTIKFYEKQEVAGKDTLISDFQNIEPESSLGFSFKEIKDNDSVEEDINYSFTADTSKTNEGPFYITKSSSENIKYMEITSPIFNDANRSNYYPDTNKITGLKLDKNQNGKSLLTITLNEKVSLSNITFTFNVNALNGGSDSYFKINAYDFNSSEISLNSNNINLNSAGEHSETITGIYDNIKKLELEFVHTSGSNINLLSIKINLHEVYGSKTYTDFSNLSMNWRYKFDFSKYENVTVEETGLVIAKDQSIVKENFNSDSSITGRKVLKNSNKLNQYTVAITNIPFENVDNTIYCLAYVKVDGTYYFSKDKNYSVSTMLLEYTESDLSIQFDDGSSISIADLAYAFIEAL